MTLRRFHQATQRSRSLIRSLPNSQTCRNRHLKCDGTKPVCSRCRRLNKACAYPGPVIRNGISGRRGLRFARDQPWLCIAKTRLRFINESLDLARYYGHRTPSPMQSSPLHEDDYSSLLLPCGVSSTPLQVTQDQHQTLASPVTEITLPRQDRSTDLGSDYTLEGNTRLALQHETDTSRSWCLEQTASLQKQPIVAYSVNAGGFETSALSIYVCSSTSHTSSPESTTFWPSRDAQEASLMRYFVEELAQWFDSCDLARHFALVAPYRAPSCPALLYAIFSASARHLSQCQNADQDDSASNHKDWPAIGAEVALEYQSLCISHLMALSGDSTDVQDENLLAAAVILRFYEELDAPLAGVDDETYLRGTQVFLEAQSAMAVNGDGLQSAALWVGIRQEFHTAFIKQRFFRFDLACYDKSPYRTLETADDSTWANRVILHCAESLMYCYGNEAHDPDRYNQLWEYNQSWHSCKPQTFNPIYSREPDRSKNEIFPQIWYLGDCQVTAVQHWHLARILLAAFDPKMPRIGPNMKRAAANTEAEIKSNIFSLCGIASSNKTAPGLITACMGVSTCGDRFTDKLEQEALLEILIRTEKAHALSTGETQRKLKESWG